MNELLQAFEAMIRKIVDEAVAKAISEQLSEGNFDSVVLSAIENNQYVISAIDGIVTTAMDDHDFSSKIETAVKNMTFEMRMY